MTTNTGHSCEPKYQSKKDSTHKLKVYMTGNVKLNKCTCLSVRLKTEFLHVWSLRCLIVLMTACQCTVHHYHHNLSSSQDLVVGLVFQRLDPN